MQKTSIFNLKFGFYVNVHPYSQLFRSQSLQYTRKTKDRALVGYPPLNKEIVLDISDISWNFQDKLRTNQEKQ